MFNKRIGLIRLLLTTSRHQDGLIDFIINDKAKQNDETENVFVFASVRNSCYGNANTNDRLY